MDSNSNIGGGSEVAFEVLGLIRLYKDGRVDRLWGTDVVPPSVDPATGVLSKDVVIDPATGVSARIYLPLAAGAGQEKTQLPVLVYFHGGAFVIETAFSPVYHGYLNSVAARVQVVAVSVDYRRAPEHPLPAAYDDSWAALRWVASHAGGGGPEPWLAEHGDLGRVFLAGDSAGANIAHHLAMRAGTEGLGGGAEIEGIVLAHPYFWGTAPVGSENTDPAWRGQMEAMWRFVCPSSARGLEDPRVNPAAEGAPSLAGLGCRRVLICVAEKDIFRDRGRLYLDSLRGCGWTGAAEMLESEGEDHVFHLQKPSCDKATHMMERLATFILGERIHEM